MISPSRQRVFNFHTILGRSSKNPTIDRTLDLFTTSLTTKSVPVLERDWIHSQFRLPVNGDLIFRDSTLNDLQLRNSLYSGPGRRPGVGS